MKMPQIDLPIPIRLQKEVNGAIVSIRLDRATL